LTIKSTSHTTRPYVPTRTAAGFSGFVNATFFTLAPASKARRCTLTCVLLMPVNIQLSKIDFLRIQESESRSQNAEHSEPLAAGFCLL